MISHIIKLIWNRRGKNSLLMIEIFICFMILFGVLSFSIQQYDRYTEPLGFETENRLVAKIRIPEKEGNADSALVVDTKKAILAEVRQLTEVAEAGYANGTIPYGGSQWTWGDEDENGREIQSHYFMRDDQYKNVMDLQMVQGHWFTEEDFKGKYEPAVVSQMFADEYYPDTNIVGMVIKFNREFKVVGVVDHYKYQGEFAEEFKSFFAPFEITEYDQNPMLLIKLKGKVPGAFEKKLNEVITQTAGGFSFSVSDMDFQRKRNSMKTWVLLIAMITVCGFLVFNVMLGLFGVLWYNIRKRKSEIGLRKALGATRLSISNHFIGEMFVVTAFALALGIFFAVQFPLLNIFEFPARVYFKAIFLSLFIIFGLVLFCAFLPSRQASALTPAVALHEE